MDPDVGLHFLHIKNDGTRKHLIYTQNNGLLPNDIKKEKTIWESGIYCSNGMKECMTKRQFSIWWAGKIEKAYEECRKTKSIQHCKST